ncbi:L-lactate MFS transporter [Halonatronum saccharophilum]|uniref:L-lactate MFS transporter n=1 Tax=Halonatronum saccharophilum TaxID=150060 RepID=UPI0004860B78|nr:OFA family MFS transporter [Halonatronum saccharophilum]
MEVVEDQKFSQQKNRWMYIPLGLIIFMCMGTVYAWSIFRKPVEELFGISATQSGLPYMAFLVSYAVLMPIAGGMIDKYGPRKMTISGGLLVSIGWLLAGFSPEINFAFLIFSYGIIGGAGVGIAYGAPMAVAAKWFPDKKGLAVGMTLGGFGLSPLVTAPLANWLIDGYGPFVAFKVIGIAFAIIITILSLPLKFPDEELGVEDEDDFEAKIDIDTKSMLNTPVFYGLWITYIIGTLTGLMAIGIASPVGEEVVGLEARQAAFMVSFFAIFNGIGRPIFGWITDRYSPKWAAVSSYILIIIASLLMLIAGEGNAFIYGLAFAIFWLNLGGWLAIVPAATAIFFGDKHYSKNYGYLFTAYGVGAIFGNFISGRLRDVLGTYLYTFYPTAILAGIGIIIAIFFLDNEKIA